VLCGKNILTVGIRRKEKAMSVKEYKEYSDTLLKLWIDNLITDGEYNRIMDRVNAVWRQTEGADDD